MRSPIHVVLVLGFLIFLVLGILKWPFTPEGCDLVDGTRRSVLAGQKHEYRCFLEKDRYLDWVVEQQDVDLTLELRDPEGALQIRIDTPNGRTGPEHLVAMTESSGVYRLLISAGSTDESPAHYVVHLQPVRKPTERDRVRARAHGLFAQAEGHRRNGSRKSLEQAMVLYRKTLPLWQDLEETMELATTRMHLGNIERSRGHLTEALDNYRRARHLYSELGEKSWIAETHINIGLIHRQRGDVEKALAFYERAQDLREYIEDPAILAVLANNFGMVKVRLGRPYEALRFYDDALRLARRHQLAQKEAVASSNLANLYIHLGKHEEARDLLRSSLAAWERTGNAYPKDQAITLGNLGVLHEALGEPERARELQLRALSVFKNLGDRIAAARAQGNLGRLTALIPGTREETQTAHRELLAAAREAGDSYSEAIALRNLAWFHLEDDPVQAEALHRQALSLFQKSGSAMDVAHGFHHLAVALQRQTRLKEAEDKIMESLRLSELLRSEIPSENLRLAYFATRQERYAFAVELLIRRHRAEPEKGHLARAFSVSQAARARDLLDSLRDPLTSIQEQADPTLLERKRVVRNQLDAFDTARSACIEASGEAGDTAACRQPARQLLAELDRIDAEIRLDLGRQIGWLEPAGIDEIRQRFLDDETVLLQYDLSPETSFLWALTTKRLELYELPAESVIEAQVNQLRTLLTRSHERLSFVPLARAQESTGHLLLEPVAHLLDHKTLMIVAEGSLESIPFSSLVVPNGAPNKEPIPLLREHDVIMLPSASVLVKLRERGSPWRPSRARVAIVADPVFDAEDPRLEGLASAKPPILDSGEPGRESPGHFRRLRASANEARTILEASADDQSVAFLGFEANRETVLAPSFSGYDIYHFATHSRIDSLHPELSGVVLSRVDELGRTRAGTLSVYEISQLQLSSRVVVLSACSTALGRDIPGEGVAGLARAFLLAGAQSVVVSLWKVDDRATAELMATFYRYLLREQLPPAAALRAAQLELSRQTRWSKPFYWAAFVLQGDGLQASAVEIHPR